MNILVTGAAGFIGFHLISQLQKDSNNKIYGIDIINDYYDLNLKYDRIKTLGFNRNCIKERQIVQSNIFENLFFIKIDLNDKEELIRCFDECKFDIVYNLAAQAGVRYSLTNPYAYIDSNISAFLNILEACRHYPVRHLLYASSSSVYGLNTKIPFSTKDNVDHPISLYAATKKSNELMAHVYSHLYNLPTTGLRFFTVYGPWGRPDMALFMFTKKIIEGAEIEVYNYGEMSRDFTYIDDIIETLIRLKDKIPVVSNLSILSPERSSAPYRVYNIGNNSPVDLQHFISLIESELNMKAKIKYLPMQPGDVANTYADVEDLFETVSYKPSTETRIGVKKFIEWYNSYYQIV